MNEFSIVSDILLKLPSRSISSNIRRVWWVLFTMNRCWGLLVIVMLSVSPGAIVGDVGSDYLDSKQRQVEQMAIQALKNYNQQCELLATCNNPTNCSHNVCEPLLGDREGLQCSTVQHNAYCSLPETSSCTHMNLDYRRGYVRVALSTNLKSMDTMLSICAQRELDPLMKSYALLNSSLVTRLFFAPMDGSWRVLPGSARSEEDCRDYEPRLRPWYRTAISVVKVVTVLIDTGASMNSILPPSFVPGTMLQAAKNIASQLLTTLSADDYVNIIVFNSTGAYQLNPQPILVQDHNSTDQPELGPLLDELNKQVVESQYRQSNFTAAILAALPNFESNPAAAKVVLVITDGVFATLGNVSLPSASVLSGVKIFLYKLPQSSDNNTGLVGNPLIQELCAVGAHFVPVLKNLENPLLVLNKYFSFLATLKRIETNGMPQYSNIYPDFEQIGGNIITVSKPVFTAEGDLIGVAGVTIYLELLNNLTIPVKNALLGRVTGYNAPSKQILLTAANCSLVNETIQPCGQNSSYYARNGGLCPKTDMKSTIQDLACCGECSSSKTSHTAGRIAGIVIGSLVGFLVVVGFGSWAYKRRKNGIRKEMEIIEKTFPNDIHGERNLI